MKINKTIETNCFSKKKFFSYRYYCPGGQKRKDPPAYYCTIGHFCPGGTAEPIPCQNNSFTKTTHSKECELCPEGFYCKIAGIPIPCPRGYYCPYGTGVDLRSCPRGTYGNQTGLSKISQCKPCDPGKYCAYEHADNVTGDCAPGYFCEYGVDRPMPTGANTTSCAPYIANSSACPYIYGKETGKGGVCPIGHYCPVGTFQAKPCPAGTYSPVTKLSVCWSCMQGYYCPGGNHEYLSRPCPSGYYCPNGTKTNHENACLEGTFNNMTARTSQADCTACSAGMYCPIQGMWIWYCIDKFIVHSQTFLFLYKNRMLQIMPIVIDGLLCSRH